MTIEVSEHRKVELITLLKKWKAKTNYRKKELQSLIGKLSFVTNCVRPGRIFLSRLIEQLKSTNNNLIYEINQEMTKDIDWWLHFLPEFNGTGILWLQDLLPPDTCIASDASLSGGGATFNQKQYFKCQFNEQVKQHATNIAQLEIFTILVALRLWAAELQGCVIRFSADSETSMYALNRGRSSDPFMLQCLREIAWISAKYQLLVRAKHIFRIKNILPDALSRWHENQQAKETVNKLTQGWIYREPDQSLPIQYTNW